METTNKATQPVSPKELKENLQHVFPDYVIKGINNAIQDKFRGIFPFRILQKDMMTSILKVAPEDVTSEYIFKNHYMDFEALYRSHGWRISYDKPGYNETYEPVFEFDKAKVQ